MLIRKECMILVNEFMLTPRQSVPHAGCIEYLHLVLLDSAVTDDEKAENKIFVISSTNDSNKKINILKVCTIEFCKSKSKRFSN